MVGGLSLVGQEGKGIMDQFREFQARTNGGRLVRVVEERPPQGASRSVRSRPRYLLEGQPLTQLNDGYLALPGSGLVMRLEARIDPPWHQWAWQATAEQP